MHVSIIYLTEPKYPLSDDRKATFSLQFSVNFNSLNFLALHVEELKILAGAALDNPSALSRSQWALLFRTLLKFDSTQVAASSLEKLVSIDSKYVIGQYSYYMI